MQPPITNVHCHIFTDRHTPDDFLATRLKNLSVAIRIKNAVRNSPIATGTIGFFNFFSNVLKGVETELNVRGLTRMLQVATLTKQADILREEQKSNKFFQGETVRYVPLSLNMDYQTDYLSVYMAKYEVQVQELAGVKASAPNTILPFFSLDPRVGTTPDEVFEEFMKKWDITQLKNQDGTSRTDGYSNLFSGIKIYPALGFFVWDWRLAKVWAYAEKHNIPIMTHCTRVGSWYCGEGIMQITNGYLAQLKAAGVGGPDKPIGYPHPNYAKIERLLTIVANPKAEGYTDELREAQFATEIFSNPYTFAPILAEFPALKICFAHFGGSEELINEGPEKILKMKRCEEKEGLLAWDKQIEDMILADDSNNIYTDISFILASTNGQQLPGLNAIVAKALAQPKLAERILWGNDSFLVLQEGEGMAILKNAFYLLKSKHLANSEIDFFDLWARYNTTTYLGF